MSFILIEFTYYFKHIFIQCISVHLYKGLDFIPDRGPKIASPPLITNIVKIFRIIVKIFRIIVPNIVKIFRINFELLNCDEVFDKSTFHNWKFVHLK